MGLNQKYSMIYATIKEQQFQLFNQKNNLKYSEDTQIFHGHRKVDERN